MSGLNMMILSGVLIAALSAFSGYSTGRKEVQKLWDADRLRIERDAERSRADAVQAVQDRLLAEMARGESLSQRLAETQNRLNQKQKELSREISRTTAGRPCLDPRTVRLLNGASSGADASSDAMPKAASVPAATDGAVATDTDVAHWVNEARAQYDLCRERLDALIDFEEGRQ